MLNSPHVGYVELNDLTDRKRLFWRETIYEFERQASKDSNDQAL